MPFKPSKHSPLLSPNIQRRNGLTKTLDQESQNLQGCQVHHHIISYENYEKENKDHKETLSRLVTLLRTDSPSALFENRRDGTKLLSPNSNVDKAGMNNHNMKQSKQKLQPLQKNLSKSRAEKNGREGIASKKFTRAIDDYLIITSR